MAAVALTDAERIFLTALDDLGIRYMEQLAVRRT
jgi:hypothetical protein